MNFIRCKFLMILMLLLSVYADDLSDVIMLPICHANGLLLYNSCVITPVVTVEQVAACATLKVNYLACLAKLTIPVNLTPATDPYALSPWSPCKFETSRLVISEVCPSV